MHDAETGRHVSRMASTAAYLADQLGMDDEQVTLLRAAAPMHDVGKVATPDEILRKPGPLTPQEREEMQRHTTVGYEILSGSDSELLQMAASIALTHHERWDGSGYPNGLKGEEIPVEGRIVAVADVFDAMLSDRCYRPALPVKRGHRDDHEGPRQPLRPRDRRHAPGAPGGSALATQLRTAPAPTRRASPPASPTTFETLPSTRSTSVDPKVWIAYPPDRPSHSPKAT